MSTIVDKLWGEALDKAVPETYSTLSMDQVEKIKQVFAGLIIRECAKVNNQFIGRRIGEIDLDMVYKEHFGVEE